MEDARILRDGARVSQTRAKFIRGESKQSRAKGRPRNPAIVPELNRSSSSESKSKNPPLERSESFLQQRAKRKVDLVVAKDEVTETDSLRVEEVEEQAQSPGLLESVLKDSLGAVLKTIPSYQDAMDSSTKSLDIATSVLSWTPDVLRDERYYEADVKKLPRLPCVTSLRDYMSVYGVVVLAEMHSSLNQILTYPEKADRPMAATKVMHSGSKKSFRSSEDCCVLPLTLLTTSFIRPSDFLFLSTTPKPWLSGGEHDVCVPAIVQSIGKLDGKIQVALKLEHLEAVKDAVAARTLLVVVVSSIASELRIYSALCRPEHSALLMKHIMAPGPVAGSDVSMECAEHELILADLVSRSKPLNPSQRRAVLAGMQPLLGDIRYPILIQGPPGTGKTHTLSSMILAVILAKPDQLIHVVAPSNAAMREVAVRLIRDSQRTGILKSYELLLLGTEQKIDTADGIETIYFNSRMERAKTASERLDDFKARLTKMAEDQTEEVDADWNSGLYFQMQEVADFGREVLTVLGGDFSGRHVDGWDSIPTCLYLLEKWKRDLNSMAGQKFPDVRRILEELDSLLAGIDMTISSEPKDLEEAIAESTKVYFTTVNSAGGRSADLFYGRSPLIILDEATQCLEPEMAILLKPDIIGLVAIGDPQQLPGVVANRKLETKGYGISLFERLLNAGSPHLLLNMQYRMHPEISQWPSNTYYNGDLQDGTNVMMSGRTPSWQLNGEELFRPYTFISCHGSEERNPNTKSYCNKAEANVVLSFLQRLLTTLIRTDHKGVVEVGCITGYAEQVRLIIRNLARLPGATTIETMSRIEKVRITVTSRCSIIIDVASVDAFQGQERDIIIFATTRANPQHRLGFLKDARRLNVALTRARFACKILGHVPTLMSSEIWKQVIGDAQLRSSYLEVSETILNIDTGSIHDELQVLSRRIAGMRIQEGRKIKVTPVVRRCIIRWCRRFRAFKQTTRRLSRVDQDMFRRLDRIRLRPLLRHAIFNHACESLSFSMVIYGRGQQTLRWATAQKGLLNKAVKKAGEGSPAEWLTAFCQSHRDLRDKLVAMRTRLSIPSLRPEDAEIIVKQSRLAKNQATIFDEVYGPVIDIVWEMKSSE